MGDFSDRNMEMETLGTAFEDCVAENPFEDELEELARDSDGVFMDDEESEDMLSEDKAEQEKIKTEETRGHDGDSEEDADRAAHEAAEEKRRLEWEAKRQAKRDAEQAQIARIAAMSEEELMAASTERIGTDTEKLTRRNMKECVSEYIQTLCFGDPAFARLVMHPKKNMVCCFQYINRKAYEYVQDEMKANGVRRDGGMQCYASDIPDDLCYHWAEEYFRTPDVKEDQEEEEKFVPKPYNGGSKAKPRTKKAAKKKAAGKKPDQKKQEKKPEADGGQISFLNQLSLPGMEEMEAKAG